MRAFTAFVAKPVRKAELRQAILGVSAQRRDTGRCSQPRLAGAMCWWSRTTRSIRRSSARCCAHLGLKVRVAGERAARPAGVM